MGIIDRSSSDLFPISSVKMGMGQMSIAIVPKPEIKAIKQAEVDAPLGKKPRRFWSRNGSSNAWVN